MDMEDIKEIEEAADLIIKTSVAAVKRGCEVVSHEDFINPLSKSYAKVADALMSEFREKGFSHSESFELTKLSFPRIVGSASGQTGN